METSMENFLNENKKKSKERTKFDCIMLSSEIKNWENDHLSIVDEKDLYIDEKDKDEYGYCDYPHITLLWGIHPDEVDMKLVKNFLSILPEIELEIKEIGIFENADYDVVKYDIKVSDDLLKYREIIEQIIPNTQTFKYYHPHMTLAYVKRGEGKKYKQKLKTPFKLSLNKAIYSDSDYKHTYFNLKKQ